MEARRKHKLPMDDLDYNSPDGIKKMMKSVTYHGLQQILKWRGIVPMRYFKKQHLMTGGPAGSVTGYTLKTSDEAEQTNVCMRFREKMKGLSQVIDDEVLQEASLVVSTNRQDIYDAAEVYTFTFRYGDESAMEMSNSAGGSTGVGVGAKSEDVAKFMFDLMILCQSTNALPNPIGTLQLRLVGPQDQLNFALNHYTEQPTPYKFGHPHVLDNFQLGQIRAEGASLGLNLRSCQVTDKIELESRMKRQHDERLSNVNSTMGSIDIQRTIAQSQFDGIQVLSPALKKFAISNPAADDGATTTYTGTASRRSAGSNDSQPKQRSRRSLRAK
ncbi:unnamed protein product, partial [Mesorhabditis spiculigera]